MSCTTGSDFTLCLSDEGIVYSFGGNYHGQLGRLSNNRRDSVPKVINIPKIKQVSCGISFSACLDEEGFLWTFGSNFYGQLGTGDQVASRTPKKIQEIPPVEFVYCGGNHTLVITTDTNLWSFGLNNYGQLCLECDEFHVSKPEKTKFSNIIKISSGCCHTLFQNETGEIYGCGSNSFGELGLGRDSNCEFQASLVLNYPLDTTQFLCGFAHSLFLDSKGNVFSVGKNINGSLGLGHQNNQNILNQIPNIPPIKSFYVVEETNFLLDFDGNTWSFGGDIENFSDEYERDIPTKTLSNIKQFSNENGSFGTHFFAKDYQNTILVKGSDTNGQCGNNEIAKIWGENSCNLKSARK